MRTNVFSLERDAAVWFNRISQKEEPHHMPIINEVSRGSDLYICAHYRGITRTQSCLVWASNVYVAEELAYEYMQDAFDRGDELELLNCENGFNVFLTM